MSWHVSIERVDGGYRVGWKAGAESFQLNKKFDSNDGARTYADALKAVLTENVNPLDRDAVVRALKASLKPFRINRKKLG